MADADGGYDYALYRYTPSLPLAIAAVAIFAVLTLGVTFRMIRSKAWFCVPFVVGGVFQVIGYIGRILSHFESTSLGPYIIQSLLILLAPALYAASIYMVLGRVIAATGATHLSLLPLRWQTRFFVCGDVVSFLVQMMGGGIQAAGTLELLHTGEKIILVGLWIQIAFFGFFIVSSTIFHIRLAKNPTVQSSEQDSGFDWVHVLAMLYTVSGLIMVRSVFRVIEYIQGNDGYLLRNEWTLFVFDAALMALTMAVFWIKCPIKLRAARKGELLAMESVASEEVAK